MIQVYFWRSLKKEDNLLLVWFQIAFFCLFKTDILRRKDTHVIGVNYLLPEKVGIFTIYFYCFRLKDDTKWSKCYYTYLMGGRLYDSDLMVWFMVFNATFNNISVISWQSVLLVEETWVPGGNTTDLSQVTDKLYHIMLYQVHLIWAGFKLTTLVVIGIDCTGCWKSNYHTITVTSAPQWFESS
jgi:hypothetical protein